MKNIGSTIDEFVSKNGQFLEQEREAEERQRCELVESRSLAELCHAGFCLTKLRLVELRSTFGGRKLLKFATKHTDAPPLPNHKFGSGDLVDIGYSNSHKITIINGVVSRVRDCAIYISCERSTDLTSLDSENRTFALTLAVNDVTYRRLKKSLARLGNFQNQHGRSLAEFLFCERELPTPSEDPEPADFSFIDPNLNDPQKEAVRFCLNSTRPISVIHGPPGTGKTRTIVEVIKQSAKNGLKTLVCCPSNVAVDNVVTRLVDCSLKLLRIGHPARSHASLHPYTLDAQLAQSDQSQLIEDIRHELDTMRLGREQRRQLRQELKDRESKALKQLLTSCDIICSTLTSADFADGPLKVIAERPFDLVVIDECAQALEIACWNGLLQSKKCVLAGDHCQLPPTIISKEASQSGFSVTLMERIEKEFAHYHNQLFRLLTIQYRMNKCIMEWSSERFYSNRLEAHLSVAKHKLSDLIDCEEFEPLLLIDTDGFEMNELETDEDESKGNIGEVKLVYLHLKSLVDAGVKEADIAVISPYNLQVQLMRMYVGSIYPNISIRSVDGFQGQEREVVVLSLVRSNKTGNVGFLSDKRRINVAVTRARRHLAVICDSRTVKCDKNINSLLEHFSKFGNVSHAAEYSDQLATVPFDVDLSSLLTPKESNTEKKYAKNKQKPKKDVKVVKDTPNSTPSVAMVTDPGIPSWQQDLLDEIEDFCDSEVTKFEFPPSLTARQRAFVHEFAEERNFSHKSYGQGSERRIVLEKYNESASDLPHEVPPMEVPPVELPPELPPELPKTPPKPKPPKKQKPKQKKPNIDEENDEDFMEKFAQAHSKCQLEGCKTLTNLLACNCTHCGLRYCLAHGQPEVHGCGERAKIEARKNMKKEFEGLSNPSSRTKDQRKIILQKKMDDKLKKMEIERKNKKSK